LTSRIPSLDGLRAIAILIVCLSHVGAMKNTPFPHFVGLGNLGVRVFFVISGMLITRLLMEERRRTGSISLKRFYIRRTLRIFPALWVYIAVIAGLSFVGIISVPRIQILRSLTYTVNYYQMGRSWYIGHIWSLSVEEQFYLLWPLVLVLGGWRAGRRIAIVAIVLAPLLRVAALLTLPGAHEGNPEWFPTACDAIATGCLLALLSKNRRWQVTIQSMTAPWLLVLTFVVVALDSLHYRFDHGISILLLDSIGLLLINFGIALIVERVTTYPEDCIGRLLNSRPMTWLGSISYSLYLWQMPFLNHQDSGWITRLPINLIAALLAAAASFYFVETPILSVRKRFGWGEGESVPSTSQVRIIPLTPNSQGHVSSGHSQVVR